MRPVDSDVAPRAPLGALLGRRVADRNEPVKAGRRAGHAEEVAARRRAAIALAVLVEAASPERDAEATLHSIVTTEEQAMAAAVDVDDRPPSAAGQSGRPREAESDRATTESGQEDGGRQCRAEGSASQQSGAAAG